MHHHAGASDARLLHVLLAVLFLLCLHIPFVLFVDTPCLPSSAKAATWRRTLKPLAKPASTLMKA